MCEYCKNINTGDDYFPIIGSNQSFGFFGDVSVDVFLAKQDEKPMMFLGMCESNGSGSFEITKEIKFCPMCGEELSIVDKQMNNLMENLARKFSKDVFDVCIFMNDDDIQTFRYGRLKLRIHKNPILKFDISTFDVTDDMHVDDVRNIYIEDLESEVYKIISEIKE